MIQYCGMLNCRRQSYQTVYPKEPGHATTYCVWHALAWIHRLHGWRGVMAFLFGSVHPIFE